MITAKHTVRLAGRKIDVPYSAPFFEHFGVDDAIDTIWREVLERVNDYDATPVSLDSIPRREHTLAGAVTVQHAARALVAAGLLRADGDALVAPDPLWRAVAKGRKPVVAAHRCSHCGRV